MKEIYTALYPNEQVATKVGDYAQAHSSSLPPHIATYHAWASEKHPDAHLMISTLQAQYQIWLSKAMGAKRVLEIGCFIGFSALAWADAVGKDGHVTTLEFDQKYADQAEKICAEHGVKNVEVVVGDARELIKTIAKALKDSYDLVFIDADKTSYPTYLSQILEFSQSSSSIRLLRQGGVIMADNILRRGLVADSSDANPWSSKEKQAPQTSWEDSQLKALDDFNKQMVGEKRIDTFLMPMFDGLGLGRLRD